MASALSDSGATGAIDEARKRAEEDAAWALLRLPEREFTAFQRREWLLQHGARQKWCCAYCGCLMTNGQYRQWPDRRATIDHVLARSVGGPDTVENTLAALRPLQQRQRQSAAECVSDEQGLGRSL